MIAQVVGAIARAFLVMMFIATPSLSLTMVSAESAQIVALVAVCAGTMTFFEYSATYPGILEFRDAPPFNRIRFGAMFISVLTLSLIWRGETDPDVTTRFARAVTMLIGQLLDFPYSPVHLFTLILPENAPPERFALVRDSAGFAYLASITSICLFSILIRVNHWPNRHRPFNIWVNLPTFDPTVGGDIVHRLQRNARINIALGFLLPFLFPAGVTLLRAASELSLLDDPQTLIWMITGWAIIPSSIFMRGLAIQRIAHLIESQRHRAAPHGDSALQPA